MAQPKTQCGKHYKKVDPLLTTTVNRSKIPNKALGFTFNPNLPDVGNIIRKHLFILQSKPKLKELFPRNSILPSVRRSKNLKELLAPSRFQTASERQTIPQNNSCFKCDRKRCDLCQNFFVESKSFLSFQMCKNYTIHSTLSSDSKNLICLASYEKCRLHYLGSTTTDFKVRFRNHKSAMLTKQGNL